MSRLAYPVFVHVLIAINNLWSHNDQEEATADAALLDQSLDFTELEQYHLRLMPRYSIVSRNGRRRSSDDGTYVVVDGIGIG